MSAASEGQYAVETSQGGENCTLTGQGENGWKAECPSLKYGEMITIRFKCQASGGFQWTGMGKYCDCNSG